MSNIGLDPNKESVGATLAISLILATVAAYIAIAGKLAPPPSCTPLTTSHALPAGCAGRAALEPRP